MTPVRLLRFVRGARLIWIIGFAVAMTLATDATAVALIASTNDHPLSHRQQAAPRVVPPKPPQVTVAHAQARGSSGPTVTGR